MTTIAWDGKTLAADKRCVNNGLCATVTKLFQVGDLRVAVSGEFDQGLAMVAWLRSGQDPAAFPEKQKDNTKYCPTAVIDDGKFLIYETTPYPLHIEDTFYAIGSGRDFALAAMYLGKTAVEAVELASKFDAGTGNGVDYL